MKEQTSTLQVQVAVISDRGLSQKRPLNEDSYLSDPARCIFAVADGVGGANAGEVASQTAMEVLDDAFRNQEPNADIEDLMELAIQRANASIHQLAREHPKLAAMATTVVALHLDGQIATIGHVGDSRLYRLTPDGKLHRDTADHSVVEEEVRAGRMTPEQAAHHPSRNVISRALGAEPSVEVDMKILEVEEGTAFMLCSDGITRHIPDNEIRDILSSYRDLEETCTEMKRRCYERGAEDNLTAVVVRVGAPPADGLAETSDIHLHDTLPGLKRDGGQTQPQPQPTAPALTPASRLAFPVGDPAQPPPSAFQNQASGSSPNPKAPPPTAARSSSAGALGRALLLLLLMAGVGAAAFFAGRYQAGRELTATANTNATPTPTVAPTVNPETKFDKRRREVDRDPLGNKSKMEQEMKDKPLNSFDPESLYFYGRALLLSNQHNEAANVLKVALDKLKDSQDRSLIVDTKMAAVIATLRTHDPKQTQEAPKDLDDFFDIFNKSFTLPSSNANTPSGATNSGEAAASP